MNEYDILVKFTYDGNEYVLCTDNTFDKDGNIRTFGACVDKEGRLSEVSDVDMDDVFRIVGEQYRDKVLEGEV